MANSYRAFVMGDSKPFVELIEDFLLKRSTRSAASSNEFSLQMAVELLWLNEAQCISEVCLVVDPTKLKGDGRFGFVDMLVGNSHWALGQANSIPILELKHISLLSLWKATQKDPAAKSTSSNDFQPIRSGLGQASEDDLLNREFAYFDDDSKQWRTERVSDMMDSAASQLQRYLITMCRGAAAQWANHGVLDDRVRCGTGHDILLGYVLLCVGGSRVLCRPTEKRHTDKSFVVASPCTR
jgi:hypothetical protein